MKLTALSAIASLLTWDVDARKVITHELEIAPKNVKHDVVTMDIVNHSDLQVMIVVYVGSKQERHKLIVDSGSMVSGTQTNSHLV